MTKECIDAAVYGLHHYSNANKGFHYTVQKQADGSLKPLGNSLRYATISHIGISRWLAYHPQDKERLPALWDGIQNELEKTNDIGDVALCLWAGCEKAIDTNVETVIDRFITLWHKQKEKCNSVELGWVLKACLMVNEMMPESNGNIDSIRKESYARLSYNYNSTARLFYRHRRKGLIQKVNGQIACFADQVYPIVAMSHYYKLYNDQKAKTMAAQVVDQICKYQGIQGQWMWHYDVAHNRVCEEYPVFSVHQDAMAPMAIFASDEVSDENHRSQIELGAKWLLGNNELGENLVMPEEGMIWRDIERDEPEKWTRNFKGLCYTYNLKAWGDRITEKYSTKFKINYECRPYHLGWILYAWADKAHLGGVQ